MKSLALPLTLLAAPALAGPCDTNLPIDMPSNCADITVSSPFEGLHNFRELTNDGGIKAGILFRSDQLDELTDADVAAMSEMGITTIVDLRAHEELEQHPNRQIPSVEMTVNLPIGTDPADVAKIMPVEVAAQIRPMWFEGKFDEINQLLADHNVDIPQVRIDRYEEFAEDFTPQVSRYMHLLADESNFPMVFHCAGGKDRTGFVAAVTMLALGYSEEAVMDDYLTTNVYTFEELEGLVGKGPESLRPIFGAHPEQMTAALAAVKAEYGSFDAYLRDGLGVDEQELASIRANLLN